MTQPNQSEPVNKVEVCMWQLRDIEETIADATPDELPELHAKLLALSSGLTDFITADRKRVVLEARIDELERVYPQLQKHYGVSGDGNYYYDDRIAELKAQLEE